MNMRLSLCLLSVFFADGAAGLDEIPQPRRLELDGLHAYAEKIITAGETLHIRVSSTLPYEMSICRLGREIDDPDGDMLLTAFPPSSPISQPIYPGSFAHIAQRLPPDQPLTALTLECWVRPWQAVGWQTLISQHDYPTACGYGLFLDGEGNVQFYLGDDYGISAL